MAQGSTRKRFDRSGNNSGNPPQYLSVRILRNEAIAQAPSGIAPKPETPVSTPQSTQVSQIPQAATASQSKQTPSITVSRGGFNALSFWGGLFSSTATVGGLLVWHWRRTQSVKRPKTARPAVWQSSPAQMTEQNNVNVAQWLGSTGIQTPPAIPHNKPQASLGKLEEAYSKADELYKKAQAMIPIVKDTKTKQDRLALSQIPTSQLSDFNTFVSQWPRAWGCPQFRANSGPQCVSGVVRCWMGCGDLPGSARGQRRGVGGEAGSGCRVYDPAGFAWVPWRQEYRGLGRRRPFDRRPRCSPQLGARAWVGCRLRDGLSVQAHLRTRGEGWAVEEKGRQLRTCRRAG